MRFLFALKKKIFFAVFFLFLGYFVADFSKFISEIRDNLEEEQAQSQTMLSETFDVIAVLTGAQGRVKESLKLFEKGRGRILFVSGADEGQSLEAILLASDYESMSADLKSRIVLDQVSRTTEDNAREIAKFLNERGLRSVILVTSSYHLPRAKKLFLRELRGLKMEGLKIQSFSVESSNFEAHNWWTKTRGWFLMVSEYFKMKTTGLRAIAFTLLH